MSFSKPISSTTRTTRSRFSSPQTAVNGTADLPPSSLSSSSLSKAQGSGTNGGTNETDKQKAFMQQWLEPPVQVRASYQDAGLVRHGVFENMAPLGTLPKTGLFRKTAPPAAAAPEHTPAPTPRIVVLKKPVVPQTPVVVTRPAPDEDETEEDETQEEDNETTDENADLADEETEGDHATANHKSLHNQTSAAAAQRKRGSVAPEDSDDEDWAPGTPTHRGAARRRSMSRASNGNLQQDSASANAGSQSADRKHLIDKVVDAAVGEAVSHFRYPTAWALRTLYDENSSNHEFLTMIETVFLQTANADTLEEFGRLLQAKKKEGKKADKALHFFEDPATNGRLTPHQPKRAPYGNLVKFDISTLRLDPVPAKSAQKKVRPAKAPVPAPEPKAEPERDAEPAELELPPRKKRKSGRQHSEATAPSAKMASSNGTDSKAKMETPSRRRTRAHSVSSISSLSSARSLSPPGEDPEDGEEGEGFDETPSRTSPVPPQPITTAKRRRSNAPRKSRNVSPSRPPSSASTTTAPHPQGAAGAAAVAAPSQSTVRSQRQSPAVEQPSVETEHQPYEMPAVVDSPLFPNLNQKKGSKSGTPALVLATKIGKLDPEDPKLRLRAKARIVTNKVFPDSNVRGSSPQPVSQERGSGEPVTPAPAAATTPAPSRPRSALPSSRPTPAPREGRSTRSSLKRPYDDLEDQPSPTAINFPGSEVASTPADSRAGTPALRTAKKPRTGLRVKTSPMKRKTGPSAGIPRPSGERSSPIGNGNAAREQDDNDDYCSSCSGNGELICCDGCTRSFHFTCVDPVLMQDAMPVEWFCNVCRANRDPAGLPRHDGPFALLLDKLEAKNSSAFRLPVAVRERFEGVRTGLDGEYEEIVPALKPARKKKSDEDQMPDFFRLRDADGNAAICHACQQGSESTRAIIPCSACGLFWHLDCLDPPMANPPVLRTWKCPLHADELLETPARLGPAHKYRKIKDAPVIRPAFTRGYVNNGYVEVDLDDSENESGWRDFETFGRTVRLSEMGIKLDFLSRIYRDAGVEEANAPSAVSAAPTPAPTRQVSLEEQQAALNLQQLGEGDGVASLIDALISQADPGVIDIMARANPSNLKTGNLNQMDQQSLRGMLAMMASLTERVQQILDPDTAPAPPPPQADSSTTSTDDPAAAVPILTPSQSPEAEPTDTTANVDAETSALDFETAKSPASDDVPAMTQGEKTPVQGDQSPAAPLHLEESTPIEGAGVPATPTKAAAIPGDVEPVVLEAGGDGEKTLGEGPDGAPLDI